MEPNQSSEKSEILVQHDGEMFKFEVVKNIVTLESLKGCFPDITGLLYNTPDGFSHSVPRDPEKFFIPQGVTNCFVRVPPNTGIFQRLKGQKTMELTKMLTDLQPNKKLKLSEKIKKKETQGIPMVSPPILPEFEVTQKELKCRWFHRDWQEEKYIQKSTLDGKKVKTLLVDHKPNYSSVQMLEDIKNLFRDQYSIPIFKYSDLLLANWDNKLANFDDIWTYLKREGKSPSKAYFHLLTRAIQDMSVSQIMESFPDVNNPNAKQSTGTTTDSTAIQPVPTFKRPTSVHPSVKVLHKRPQLAQLTATNTENSQLSTNTQKRSNSFACGSSTSSSQRKIFKIHRSNNPVTSLNYSNTSSSSQDQTTSTTSSFISSNNSSQKSILRTNAPIAIQDHSKKLATDFNFSNTPSSTLNQIKNSMTTTVTTTKTARAIKTITTTTHTVETNADEMTDVVSSFTILYGVGIGDTPDTIEYFDMPKRDLYDALCNVDELIVYCFTSA